MKKCFYLFLPVFLAASACHKDGQKQCDTFFVITAASSVAVTTVTAGIPVVVNSYGGDMCFHYTGLSVSQQSSPSGPVYLNQYFIRATGIRDCGDEVVCAQALVNARDSIMVRPATAGTYYLHFQNATGLFRTDTVVVN